jgi:hypothetical protein
VLDLSAHQVTHGQEPMGGYTRSIVAFGGSIIDHLDQLGVQAESGDIYRPMFLPSFERPPRATVGAMSTFKVRIVAEAGRNVQLPPLGVTGRACHAF